MMLLPLTLLLGVFCIGAFRLWLDTEDERDGSNDIWTH
jgi:hypothetical protein